MTFLSKYLQAIRLISNLGIKPNLILPFIISTFAGLIDLLGIAAILPAIYIIINPKFIEENNFISKIYSKTGVQDHTTFILIVLVSLFMLLITKNVIAIFLRKWQLTIFTKLSFQISQKILQSYFLKGHLFFVSSEHSVLWRNVMVNSYALGHSFLQQFIVILGEILLLSLIILSIAIYEPSILVVLLFFMIPSSLVFYKGFKKKMSSLGQKTNALYTQANGNLLNIFDGHTEIISFNKEHFFFERFFSKKKKLDEHEITLATFDSIPSRYIETIAIGIIFSLLFYQIVENNSVEKIITLISILVAAAYRIIPSISKIMVAAISINKNDYILSVLKEDSKDIVEKTKAKRKIPFKNKIELKSLSFSYPNSSSRVLNNLDLTIIKGDCIGIIGRSGSGKSTLIKILLGLIYKTKGEFVVDNNDLFEEDLMSWRNNLGYVPQDVFILNETLDYNIAFEEQISNSAKNKINSILTMLQLDKIEGNFEENKKLGDKGAKISGGQKQRIGIARALYKDASLLILDEFTSALDKRTELQIMEEVKKLKINGLTIVIISHNDRALKFCDKIYEMNEGKLTSKEVLNRSLN